MIVLYLKSNNQFLQAIKGFPEVEERDNRLYFKDGKVIINDLTKAGYKEYPDQEITLLYDDEGMEMPQTLEQLKLRDFTPNELLEKDITLKSLANEIKTIKDRLLIIEAVRIK